MLDWELTMKCNLDCSYCGTGLYSGHDNSQSHPPVADCLRTIDFMFEYVDIYMTRKPRGIKYVILNMYGGEALHHPDIVEILTAVRERQAAYQDRWHLTITTTTNAIVNSRILDQIIPLIDEFTVSYHVESTPKQQQQFRDNLLKIQAAGVRQKCIVMLHPDQFDECLDMTNWLTENNISQLPKQIDHPAANTEFNYQPQQVIWFEKFYKKSLSHAIKSNNNVDLAATGRSCCGGRQMCVNQDRQNPHKFVDNHFPNWYCSVDQFFLYVKQINGEVYVNKDCKMNFDGTVGPIGTLNNVEPILQQARDPNRPTIRCAKHRCDCGLCAPKAADQDTYKNIMRKYEIPTDNLL